MAGVRSIFVRVIPVGPRRAQAAQQDFAVTLTAEASSESEWRQALPWKMGFDRKGLLLLRVDATGKILGQHSFDASVADRTPSVQGTDEEIARTAEAWLTTAFEGQQVTDEYGKPTIVRARPEEFSGILSSMWALPGDLPRRLDLVRWFRVSEALGPGDRFVVLPKRDALPAIWEQKAIDGETCLVGFDEGAPPTRWVVNVVEVLPPVNGRLRISPIDTYFNDKDLGPRLDTGWLKSEIADSTEEALHRAIVLSAQRLLKPELSYLAGSHAPVIWNAIRRGLPGLSFREALAACARSRLRELLFQSTTAAIPESERRPSINGDTSRPISGIPTKPEELDDLLEPLYGKVVNAPRLVPRGTERLVEPIRIRFGDIEDADVWRFLQGVVVFARDATVNGPWHCLNTARLQLPGDLRFRCPFTTDPATTEPAITANPAVLVPSRVIEREGITLPVESYLNRSLVFSDSLSQALGATASAVLSQARYLRPGIPRAFFMLPRVVFGHEYEFAAAMVDHGGGMADALSGADGANGKPSWDLGATSLDALSVLEATEKHRFLRRVPFGAPLVMAPGDRWPTLPNDVELLLDARRPPSQPGALVGNTRADESAIEDGTVAGRLWLLEPGEACSIEVRTPVCARDVFECWVDDEETLRAGLSWYLERAQARADAKTPIDFDDPGARILLIDIDTWSWTSPQHSDLRLFEGRWAPTTTFSIDLPSPTYGSGMVRRRTLRIRRSGGGDVSLKGEELTLPSALGGESALYRVRLRVRPREEDLGRVAPELLNSPDIAVLVELPGDAMVACETLWSGFTVSRDASMIDASLRLTGETPGLRHVRDWSVIEQEWRWGGLPHALVRRAERGVTEGVLDEADDARAWQVQMFGGRANTDTLTQRVAWFAEDDPAAASAPPRAMRLLLARESDRADLRRFSLVARGRYAGFGRPRDSVARRTDANDASWRVVLRGPRRVPAKPVIRAAVPMVSGTGSVGAFFVAVRGSGFSAAGFTEGLEARFAQDLPEGIPVGRDPTSGSFATPVSVPNAPFAVHGPWGYTLDPEGTPDPLWTSSAWIVVPPSGLMPWDFVWLQVRALASREDPNLGASPWSEPVALQALPSGAAGIHWSRDEHGWSLDDWRSFEGGPASEPDRPRSTLLLIVTRTDNDIEGREVERLDSLHFGRLDRGRWRFGEDVPGFDPGERGIRTRVAELQHPTWESGLFPLKPGRIDLQTPGASFWDLLLPTDEREAPARVVRISDVIPHPQRHDDDN